MRVGPVVRAVLVVRVEQCVGFEAEKAGRLYPCLKTGLGQRLHGDMGSYGVGLQVCVVRWTNLRMDLFPGPPRLWPATLRRLGW